MTHLPPDPAMPDEAALDRYLAGESAPEERAPIAAWLAATGSRARVLGAFQQLDRVVSVDTDALNRMRSALHTRLANDHQNLHRAPRVARQTSLRRSRVPWIMAGAVAVAAVIPLVWSMSRSSGDPEVHTYSAARMERVDITLPDGSRVTLAPQTRLQYREMSDGTRMVNLEGQALFSVMPKVLHPFLVRSGDHIAQVLGTEFDVQHYTEDAAFIVGVRSGRVAVLRAQGSSPTVPIVLAAGMAGIFSDSVMHVDSVTASDAIATWARGHLVFRKTPVPAFLRTLERWYGYEFRLADSSLAKQHVTTVLSVDKPQETMQVLKDLLEVSMTFDGSVVILSPRARQRHPSRAPDPVGRGAIPVYTEAGR